MSFVEETVSENVICFKAELELLGLPFGTRSTLIRLADQSLMLISPIKICDALEARIREFGQLKYVIAPNKFHHLYISRYPKAFPDVTLYYASGLWSKVATRAPQYKYHHKLAEKGMPWDKEVTTTYVQDAPMLDEFTFFLERDKVLVTTDLFFNFPANLNLTLTSRLLAKLMGIVPGAVSRSMLMKIATKNKEALKGIFLDSKEKGVKSVICAHGNITTENADEFIDRVIALI
ncbi:MAG: DUF4336 domain-containing protein [Pseudobacteriovorax sp.]|nr:DUF4336 domain-containing protein [Pseudobacteriovorax sp.]